MSISNLTLTNGVLSWKASKAGNAIIAKTLPLGSTFPWSAATMAQLPASATSWTPPAGVQVQIVQAQFETGAATITVPAPAPPPPPSTVYTVPAAPSCPAPTAGWGSPALADAFAWPSPFLGLNRDDNAGDNGLSPQAGFNSNEVEAFSSSMVIYDPLRGLVLTAKPQTGKTASGTSYTYLSSCCSSQPESNPEGGGTTGFPGIIGFGFQVPTAGQLALEIAATSPNGYVQGLDLGLLWGADAEGKVEWDGEEDFGYASGHPGQWGSAGALINHLTAAGQGNEVYNPAWQFDGKQHVHTFLLDGDAGKVSRYVDGVLIDSYPIPAGLPVEYMWLLISLAFRDAYPGQGPIFTDTIEIPVRYIGAWRDKAHQGVGILGGGIAPGTTVA